LSSSVSFRRNFLAKFLSKLPMGRTISLSAAVLGLGISTLGLYFVQFLSEGKLVSNPPAVGRFDDGNARFATLEIRTDSNVQGLDEVAELHITLRNVALNAFYIVLNPHRGTSIKSNLVVVMETMNAVSEVVNIACIYGCGDAVGNNSESRNDSAILLEPGKPFEARMRLAKWRDIGVRGVYQLIILDCSRSSINTTVRS